MEKLLRVASDTGGYAPETDLRYKPDGRPGESGDIERFEWVSRRRGLKEPETEVLFDLGKPRYTHSYIMREHLLAVLEAIRKMSRWIGISEPGTIRGGTGSFLSPDEDHTQPCQRGLRVDYPNRHGRGAAGGGRGGNRGSRLGNVSNTSSLKQR